MTQRGRQRVSVKAFLAWKAAVSSLVFSSNTLQSFEAGRFLFDWSSWTSSGDEGVSVFDLLVGLDLKIACGQ